MNVLKLSKVKWSYGWVNLLTNMVSMWHHQWQATNKMYQKFGMSSMCIFYTKWHSTAVARNNLFWLPFLHEWQPRQLSKFPARSVEFKEVWTTFILIRLRRRPLLLWEQLPNIRWSTSMVLSLFITTPTKNHSHKSIY